MAHSKLDVSKQNTFAKEELLPSEEKLSGWQKFVRGFKKTLWGVGCILFVPFRAAWETSVVTFKKLYCEAVAIKQLVKAKAIGMLIFKIILFPIGFCIGLGLSLLGSPFAYIKSSIENAVAWGKAVGTNKKVKTSYKYLTGKNDVVEEEFSFKSFIKFLFGITTTNVKEAKDIKEATNIISRYSAVATTPRGLVLKKDSDFDMVDFRPPMAASEIDFSEPEQTK